MTLKNLLAGAACFALIGCSGDDATPTIEAIDATNSTPTTEVNETTSSTSTIEVNGRTGPTSCPADKVITDVATYADDYMPAPSENYAAWHEANGKREGVITLESGLQYKVIRKGLKNSPSPVGPQVIRANYHGFFPDGKVFDSSYERNAPLEYKANAFIKGWNEALALMQPCSAWTLYVPGDIAYGPSGRPGIPPNATLVFNMQLLDVK